MLLEFPHSHLLPTLLIPSILLGSLWGFYLEGRKRKT
jgi:hypothetical protein